MKCCIDSVVARCAIALLAIVPCAKASPQGAVRHNRLASFCGFRAGENLRGAKFAKGDSSLAGDMVKVRKPFRRFANAQLMCTDTGELVEIDAIAVMPRVTPAALRKELDACCKELAKFDGMKELATSEWKTNGMDFEKSAEAPGVYVRIEGAISDSSCFRESSKRVASVLKINIRWDLDIPDNSTDKGGAEKSPESEKPGKMDGTEARMRKIIIPEISLKPPATLSDAVKYFAKASRDYDNPKLPLEKRGVFLILKPGQNGKIPEIKAIETKEVSLWDALGRVCADCGYRVAIERSVVVILPKDAAESLETRFVAISEPNLDRKIGTGKIKDTFKKTEKWKEWLEAKGVDWPDGSKMLYVNFGAKKMLRITNTAGNLDKIERLVR